MPLLEYHERSSSAGGFLAMLALILIAGFSIFLFFIVLVVGGTVLFAHWLASRVVALIGGSQRRRPDRVQSTWWESRRPDRKTIDLEKDDEGTWRR
jgi:hypothetical protein